MLALGGMPGAEQHCRNRATDREPPMRNDRQPDRPPLTTGAGWHRRRRGLAPWLLIGLYVVIGLAPLAITWLRGHPRQGLAHDLSSGLVMVGFAMMLMQFLLSGRFRDITGRVGADITILFHQLIAWTILAFVLLHPFLYAVPGLWPDPAQAVATLRGMFGSDALRSGGIAWWLLILLVPMAMWRDRLPIRYEIWRLSHGLGAAVIALAGLHHTLTVGTYSADPWLAGFWVVLAGLAVASLVHVYVLKPLRQFRHPYRLVSNREVADRIWEIQVEAERRPAINFAAGQFIWLNLGHSPFRLVEHPFSLSSTPADRPRLAVTVRESGDFTNRIGEIPVGTRAYVDGPYGTFTLARRRASGLAFFAGGVGLGPIIGLLRELVQEQYRGPVHLLYGNRVETQILYRDELEAMGKTLDFRLQLILSEPPEGWRGPAGELTPEVIDACLDGRFPKDWLYFVCGPVPMMESVEATLLARGVPARRIVSERFKYS
ncbi:MAG: hypothetical protein EA406_05170 [Rhodospirillales bacterium]|nr:MAG: hypothetical protein EA406_05170 [Rhodospirillales bacterium]